MLKGKLLIALASAVLFLGACSNNAEQPQTPETPATTETTTPEVTETPEVENETVENVKTFEFENEDSTDVITITYNEEGQPVDLSIDNIQADGSSKREAAANGTYDMGGELNWAEQVDALAAFIIENDFNLDAVTLTDEDGHTDAVSGVSIKVGSYIPLIEQALAGENNNVKTFEFENEDTTDVITITYNEEGQPVDLSIDNIQADGSSKREAAANGTYDMGGELNWAEQVDALAAFIVENDFNLDAVNLTDEDGHTDAVSGVSIKVGQYLPLIEEALAK